MKVEKDYVILHYDIDEIDFESLKNCYDSLNKTFEDKIIIVLPRLIKLTCGDKTDLEVLLDGYKQAIKVLEGVMNE